MRNNERAANKNSENQGWVYILTNPSFREDWVKIGKSSRPVEVRLKELDNTAVPLPFEIYATLKTAKYEIVEKKIHKAIDILTHLRIRPNREFFNIKPELAFEILSDEATLLDDAELRRYKDNKPICQNLQNDNPEPEKTRKPRFKFSMVNIPIGARIVFIPTGVEVKVAEDDQIEYEGRIYRLSSFVGTFMPEEQRNTSGAYQGAKYFSYNGRVLDDLRHDMESSLEDS